MSFTDEDLKRLKGIDKKHRNIVIEGLSGMPSLNLTALLARLEAAENFIKKSFMPIEWEDHPDYQAWLQSKSGKGE